MPNTTLRGRLSRGSRDLGIAYRWDGIDDTLILRDEIDDESVVMDSAQQIELLRLLAREYPDIARQEVG